MKKINFLGFIFSDFYPFRLALLLKNYMGQEKLHGLIWFVFVVGLMCYFWIKKDIYKLKVMIFLFVFVLMMVMNDVTGLSLKSQELTAIFLAVRLYCSFVMEYDIHTILDLATFVTTVWVIYMIRLKLKASYMEEKDNFAIYYVVSSNCLFHPKFKSIALLMFLCQWWSIFSYFFMVKM